ncbi:hypothetical protein EJD97_004495 [Solanum chilense]|uniref:DUF4219 domain-containing protein n=1 Tax=Solanum chilense TaxID=4083 RepID=A0A6N2AMU3_SOLCI|nr:hypothetical protein EJD97_004495 [Solanum chilense]
MAAPLNLEEGQSSTRPPRFDGHFYSWWKVRMHDFFMAEDSELWDIVLDGPFIPMIEEKDGEKTRLVPKPRQKYDEVVGRRSKKPWRTYQYEQAIRKVIRILPKYWKSKVDAITEAKDLKVSTMDALIGI